MPEIHTRLTVARSLRTAFVLLLVLSAARTLRASEPLPQNAGAVGTPPVSSRPAIPSVKELADRLPCTADYVDVAGHHAFLIRPKKAGGGPMPWVWYAPVIGHPNASHAWMLRQWLDKGIGMAGVDVGESCGSPAGRRVYTALWETLTRRFGMSERPCLLPQSRGGLMLYNWAAENPTRVACIAGIYTVCDLRSYPGLDRACGAYGLSAAELEARLAGHNPIDRLAPLTKAGVPIFHVHGDADTVVPLEKNAGELVRRYHALGGEARLIVVPGKGHQVCDEFFHCQELVDFVIAHASGTNSIDRETLDRWSAPYRGWHYWPDPIIPAEPKVAGHESFHNTDCPCVYQLPSRPDRWQMSFIAFNGQGYNSFVAESTDLIHWQRPRLAMGFGKPGKFDHGGCVVGAFLYDSYDIRAPRVLNRRDGKFWTLYGCYPRQGGYELRPGYEGVAVSDDGLGWRRAKDQPILSVHDPDCATWEKSCIYQPWLVEQDGRFYDFYNAAREGVEQTGVAFSSDLLKWNRYSGSPVVRVRPQGFDEQFASDPKVFRDGDHWVMFYFGVGRGGAHIMAAFSRDLLHWTAHPEPLYKAGGHPGGLDKTYAHKISLVYRPENETFYMHYCAVGVKGRCIGLLTSKRLEPSK